MCGFALIYSKNSAKPTLDHELSQMEVSIRHRGPDEQGQCKVTPIAISHCRLAIIDLVGGKQPMRSADGRFWIAFNGEIYNYKDIRHDLEVLGHQFRDRSDTEVLLTAWQQWGEACLDRLNGMFVVAIYDSYQRKLTAARDRFGEKPLYYCETSNAIYLASELKALVAAGVVDRTLDPFALYSYFTLGYVAGEQSIFRNVRRLGPGHLLTYSPQEGIAQRRWYQPPMPSEDLHDESVVTETALDLLRDSVRLRLVSDVPVGCFLSGGVDSSAVVALASEIAAGPIETFSIGFEDPRYDERPFARFVADRFGTRHHEFVLQPQGLDSLEQLVWHADEPFADQAALPTWFLSQMTRQYVKVALSGDGGDEFFAGYDVYRSYELSERVRRIPPVVRSLASALLRASSRYGSNRYARQRLARNIEDAALDAPERFIAKQQMVFRRDFLKKHAQPLARASGLPDDLIFDILYESALHPLGAIAAWQQNVSLPDDMLHKVDRMSMAHSLEVRTPFLDHRLGELMNRTAFTTKMYGNQQKYILRKALERYLPSDFLWRRKQGFAVPMTHWFKDNLADFIRDRLLAPKALVQSIIPRPTIEKILAEHGRGTRDWSYALWALLVFELWCRSYELTQENLIHEP